MLSSEIIKKIVSTWKSERQRENNNIYTFYADPSANKFKLRKVLEEIFAVKIERISSLREKPVLRNPQRNLWTKLRKKIFVKLKKGYKIGGEFSSGKAEANIGSLFIDSPGKATGK